MEGARFDSLLQAELSVSFFSLRVDQLPLLPYVASHGLLPPFSSEVFFSLFQRALRGKLVFFSPDGLSFLFAHH